MIARGTCEASWVTSVAGMVGKARFPVAVAEEEAGTSGSGSSRQAEHQMLLPFILFFQ